MNWFFLTKFAQVWDVATTGSFLDEIKRTYELEYKLSMIRNRRFSGIERRRETIEQKLEENLEESLEGLMEIFQNLFSGWLRAHAITDPQEWSVARGNEYNSGISEINNIVDEYMQYRNNNQPWQSSYRYDQAETERAFQTMLSDLSGKIEQMPSFRKLAEIQVDNYKQMLYDDLSYSGLEEFNERMGTSLADESQAENYIDSLSHTAIDVDFSNYDIETFVRSAEELGISREVFQDLRQHAVFPLWYQYWQAMGIEYTREDNEAIYSRLTSAKSIGDSIAAINLAINAVHQNGSMLDYLGEYGGVNDLIIDPSGIVSTLSALTEGDYIDEWNAELREIGVDV